MAVFVDANVVVYARSGEPDLREGCLESLDSIAAGELDGRTSVAVLEEIWHLELRGRPAGLGGIARNAYVLFTPLLAVTDEIVRDALALEASALGSNDRIHAATCRAYGIDVVLSVDAAFDELGWLRRVDPRDLGSLL